jgi:hypothetical protein
MPRMFAWRYLDEAGNVLGESHHFADQAAAETWMGEAWSDLRDRGVEEVVLVEVEADRSVYRMGLDPAER